jgi:hypothetical protein
LDPKTDEEMFNPIVSHLNECLVQHRWRIFSIFFVNWRSFDAARAAAPIAAAVKFKALAGMRRMSRAHNPQKIQTCNQKQNQTNAWKWQLEHTKYEPHGAHSSRSCQ